MVTPEIRWSDDFLIGLPDIDGQHRYFFELIVKLEATLRPGAAPGAVARLLGEMVRYTFLHFSYEETLMEAYDLDDTEAHRDEHRELLEKLDAWTEGPEPGPQDRAKLLLFVFRWFTDHTTCTDKRFAAGVVQARARI